MSEKVDPAAGPMSAEALRMSILQKEMDKMDVARKAREAEEKKLAAFTADFLHKHVSDDEIAMVRRLVVNAVKDGKMEAMVYSFPSDLCTDSGRAINNGDPNWPETLQGKAKEFYDRYEERGQAAGLPAEGDGHQLPRRRAGRHRLLPELGAAGRVRPNRSPRAHGLRTVRILVTLIVPNAAWSLHRALPHGEVRHTASARSGR